MDLAALKGYKPLLLTVWRLALPVLLTNLLQSLVNVVDVFMVGRLGPIAIAAIGMASVIRVLILVMLLAVTSGAMALISQAKGARDPERMSFVTRQSLSSGFFLSLVILVVGYFAARPLVDFANSDDNAEALLLGTQYLQIFFLGAPVLVQNYIINRLMQGAGDTVTPLFITGGMNLLNIIFNYIFMFGMGPIPAMGLQGAAVGTVLARAIGVVVGLAIIYSGRNVIQLLPGSFRPNLQMFRDIFTIGIPSGIQGIFRNGARLLVFRILSATEVGTLGLSALAIGFNIESLAFMPILGINVAATALVGQSLGSWQTDEARERGNMAIALGFILMILFTVPLVIFAPALIRFFEPSADPVVLSAGTAYMRTNTIVLPMTALAMVANGAMRGAGDSTPGMFSTMITRGAISISLAYVFGIVLGYGSMGVWIALAVGLVLDGIYMSWRWRSGAWIKVALHKTDLYRQHLRHLPEKIQSAYLQEIRTPLMAEASTTELVSEQSVRYQQPQMVTTVQFGKAGYEVEQGLKTATLLPTAK